MTKSKITLVTSSSQKFVIYLDPKKIEKKECPCEQDKSYKPPCVTKDPGSNRSRSNDSNVDKHFSTVFRNDNFEPNPSSTIGSGSEETFADAVVDLSQLDEKEKLLNDIENSQAQNDASKVESWEKLETDQFVEQPVETYKATFLETDISAPEKKNDKVIIEEKFIKDVERILEASSFRTRKQEFGDLLKNISALQLEETIEKPTNKQRIESWWPFSTTKKEPEPQPEPVPLKPVPSLPYLNHSFYHYRPKSKLEGLTFIPNKVYNYGEQGSGFSSKSGPQDYYALREQCLTNKTLFEDPEFLPKNSSLFYTHKPDRNFEWKRPKEIVKNPQLFVEGASRFDVQQGELGDCWLLAAVANLTLYKRLFSQIVPNDQSFDQEYAGIFHFRFWQYGRWVDVVVDDRLPTYKGKLVFLRSTEDNEFWSALLEKAYAKLHGSYEALKGGSTCEAMEDLTGGVTETYELKASPANLFKIILKAYARWSLMGCSLDANPDVVEARTPEGLIRGHAYSITKAQYIDLSKSDKPGEKIPLLRIRNPWGNAAEWKGAWSDNSSEWQLISDKQKEKLGLTFEADGEFWMSFTDFLKHFNHLDICNLNPDSLANDEMKEGRNKRWVMSVFEGEWVRGVTAGGCRNFLNTFYHNPQYNITLDQEDDEEIDKKCTLIVALMQKKRKRVRRSGGVDLLTIGFSIYQLSNFKNITRPLGLNFFKYNPSLTRTPKYINQREVSCRFRLDKGTYCIIPSTFDPNEEGEFLIRVFSEHQNNMQENDQKLGLTEDALTAEDESSVYEKRENELIRNLFIRVAGRDEEVDWKELKEILDLYTKKETRNRGFSKDVCRSMIAMLDTDRTGKLNFSEFKRLWTSIRNWKLVYQNYDRNQTGKLTGFELRDALSSAGYTMNNHILNILMHRYGNKNNDIEFDDFIMCAVKLKIMIELFKNLASPQGKSATFSLEDWIEYTLYT